MKSLGTIEKFIDEKFIEMGLTVVTVAMLRIAARGICISDGEIYRCLLSDGCGPKFEKLFTDGLQREIDSIKADPELSNLCNEAKEAVQVIFE